MQDLYHLCNLTAAAWINGQEPPRWCCDLPILFLCQVYVYPPVWFGQLQSGCKGRSLCASAAAADRAGLHHGMLRGLIDGDIGGLSAHGWWLAHAQAENLGLRQL
eukprot:scaffold305518_cov22-Tisochrysis_lutea.AAC.1